MARASVINPFQGFTENDGIDLLSEGTATFYTNRTTELASIYSDPDLTVAEPNPYTLNTGGQIEGDVRFSGLVSIVLKTKTGGEVRTLNDVICFEERLSFSQWAESATYGNGGSNIVTASDGNYYVSIQAANQGNDPTVSPLWWDIVYFIQTDVDGGARIDTIAGLTPSTSSVIKGTASSWELSTLGSIRNNYITGLITSNGTDADHDIDITAGVCSDSTKTAWVSLGAFTKKIDATWASGSGNGGLASGASLGNATWYHIFAVLVGGSADVMFDTSVVCANGVANNSVTHFRRIGSVLTDGSANILAYQQTGNRFIWDVIVNDATTNNPGTSAVTVTASIPLGVESTAICYLSALQASTTDETFINMIGGGYSGGAPNSTNKRLVLPPVPTGESLYYGTRVEVLSNASSQVKYQSEDTSTDLTVYVNTEGWIDPR